MYSSFAIYKFLRVNHFLHSKYTCFFPQKVKFFLIKRILKMNLKNNIFIYVITTCINRKNLHLILNLQLFPIIKLAECILTNLDRDQKANAVFMGLSKAFGKGCEVLLDCLSNYGIVFNNKNHI